MLEREINNKLLKFGGIAIFSLLCFIPVFIDLPFRPNLYLTYEGAYRLYLGQIPFRDFGTSVGPGLWIIPAVFFKIFGPYTSSLILAQVFINITSGLVLRGILRKLNVNEAVIIIILLLFYSTYAITHFWPWYNHTVFFYQLVALYLLILCFEKEKLKSILLYSILSAFFTFVSLMTKQDGGGFTFLICNVLLLFIAVRRKKILHILTYNLFFTGFFAIFILSFKNNDVLYWLNLGQEPHTSRLFVSDILNDFFAKSRLMKFFLFSILLALIQRNIHSGSNPLQYLFKEDERYLIFALLMFSIVFESTIIQVTSYAPPETINYFYSFGFVFILHELHTRKFFNVQKAIYFGLMIIAITFIWSENYWVYGQKLFPKLAISGKAEDAISKYNLLNPALDSLKKTPQTRWEKTGLKSVDNIKFPQLSKKGILKTIALGKAYNKENLRVLNMSQLTFLAYEMNFIPEANQRHPLWYHKGVNLFDREIDYLCDQISKGTYDIIIFQDVPLLRNYFPYEVTECAESYYEKKFDFPSNWTYADSMIEVYVLK